MESTPRCKTSTVTQSTTYGESLRDSAAIEGISPSSHVLRHHLRRINMPVHPYQTALLQPLSLKFRRNLLCWELIQRTWVRADGVSVMFGRHLGVRQPLRRDSPYMAHIHRVSHRLVLVCSTPPRTSITWNVTRTHGRISLYTFPELGLQTWSDNERALKLKEPINICWLAMENAVH